MTKRQQNFKNCKFWCFCVRTLREKQTIEFANHLPKNLVLGIFQMKNDMAYYL